MASLDGESAGTVVRVSVTRRVIEGDLERLARSMQMASAFGSSGFCDDHVIRRCYAANNVEGTVV